MNANKKFDFKTWFENEVRELEKDPEYIAYGEEIEVKVYKSSNHNESELS